MACDACRSDQINQSFFRLAEPAHSEPQKEYRNHNADNKSRRIELRLRAENAPAEAVDHSDHRIQRIKQTPLWRHDAGTEPDRRDIEPQLHQKRDYVPEVAVFDI